MSAPVGRAVVTAALTGAAIASAAAAVVAAWTGAGGWLDVSAVARRLGYSDRRVRQMIVAGIIPAMRVTPTSKWRVPAEWMRAHLTGGVVRRKPGAMP